VRAGRHQQNKRHCALPPMVSLATSDYIGEKLTTSLRSTRHPKNLVICCGVFTEDPDLSCDTRVGTKTLHGMLEAKQYKVSTSHPVPYDRGSETLFL